MGCTRRTSCRLSAGNRSSQPSGRQRLHLKGNTDAADTSGRPPNAGMWLIAQFQTKNPQPSHVRRTRLVKCRDLFQVMTHIDQIKSTSRGHSRSPYSGGRSQCFIAKSNFRLYKVTIPNPTMKNDVIVKLSINFNA